MNIIGRGLHRRCLSKLGRSQDRRRDIFQGLCHINFSDLPCKGDRLRRSAGKIFSRPRRQFCRLFYSNPRFVCCRFRCTFGNFCGNNNRQCDLMRGLRSIVCDRFPRHRCGLIRYKRNLLIS